VRVRLEDKTGPKTELVARQKKAVRRRRKKKKKKRKRI
jgi:hypothetical protein